VVLKDRQNLGQNGMIIVSVAMQAGGGQIIGGPELITRGFIYEKENEDVIDELEGVVHSTVDKYAEGCNDVNKLKNDIKDTLKGHIWRKTKRTPVIITVVLTVNA